jgi:hypothetical protein
MKVHDLESLVASSWAPVAHAYNPSYSGGRDQEDSGSRLVQANSWWDLILKKPITKERADEVAQGVGPEFRPQFAKNKNLWKTK